MPTKAELQLLLDVLDGAIRDYQWQITEISMMYYFVGKRYTVR